MAGPRNLMDLHVQVRLDLFDHQRFLKLLDLLDDDDLDPRLAHSSLILLWVEAMKRQQDGDFTDWSARDIAHASHWPKTAKDQWRNALIGSGFLHHVEGRLLIRNWPEYSGKVFVQRKTDAERKAGARAEQSGQGPDVRRTSGGLPEDVQAVSAQNGHAGPDVRRTSNGIPAEVGRTSLRAEIEDLRPETKDELTNSRTHVRAYVREEDDDFLATLGDDPGTPIEDAPDPFDADDLPGVLPQAAESDAEPALDADVPGVTKLRPLDERARAKKRAASDDDIRELNGHFEPSFRRELEPLGVVDWQQVYRRAWQGTVVQYEGASAEDLNNWLHQRLEQAKARAGVPPPSVAAIARAGTPTIDPYAAIEIRASA